MTSAFVQTKDGVDIFYKDLGPKDAQPIMFHHGWPLSSDDWDAQLLFFLSKVLENTIRAWLDLPE